MRVSSLVRQPSTSSPATAWDPPRLVGGTPSPTRNNVKVGVHDTRGPIHERIRMKHVRQRPNPPCHQAKHHPPRGRGDSHDMPTPTTTTGGTKRPTKSQQTRSDRNVPRNMGQETRKTNQRGSHQKTKRAKTHMGTSTKKTSKQSEKRPPWQKNKPNNKRRVLQITWARSRHTQTKKMALKHPWMQ